MWAWAEPKRAAKIDSSDKNRVVSILYVGIFARSKSLQCDDHFGKGIEQLISGVHY
jgi:hypothetical protein